jgi:hypothetical protein
VYNVSSSQNVVANATAFSFISRLTCLCGPTPYRNVRFQEPSDEPTFLRTLRHLNTHVYRFSLTSSVFKLASSYYALTTPAGAPPSCLTSPTCEIIRSAVSTTSAAVVLPWQFIHRCSSVTLYETINPCAWHVIDCNRRSCFVRFVLYALAILFSD